MTTKTIPRNLHEQGLCNAVTHICIRSHAFAACVLFPGTFLLYSLVFVES